jgi:hypothetical protein
MFFEYDATYYHINLDSLTLLRIPFKPIRKIKRDATKSKSRKGHFEAFLSFYKLARGTIYVETSVLYYLYDKWVYNNNNKNPLGYQQFFKFLSIYFDKKRLTSSKVSFFGINDIIPQDELDKANNWARKHHEKSTKVYKEKNSKKGKRGKKEETKDHEVEGEISSLKPPGKPEIPG